MSFQKRPFIFKNAYNKSVSTFDIARDKEYNFSNRFN